MPSACHIDELPLVTPGDRSPAVARGTRLVGLRPVSTRGLRTAPKPACNPVELDSANEEASGRVVGGGEGVRAMRTSGLSDSGGALEVQRKLKRQCAI